MKQPVYDHEKLSPKTKKAVNQALQAAVDELVAMNYKKGHAKMMSSIIVFQHSLYINMGMRALSKRYELTGKKK